MVQTPVSKFLMKKFLEYQNFLAVDVKAKEFAKYLDVPITTYSSWMNAGIIPSMEYCRKVSGKLGPEIYDACGYARPGRQVSIDNLPPELQQRLSDLVSEINSSMVGIDPSSTEAGKIIKSLIDKHGFTYRPKR